MKKWLIICIAFMQLASTTQFSQLYKLPIFVTHYLEHSQNTLSFEAIETYIIHHYGGHEMDEDWDIDQKLPFMHADRVHLDPCIVSNFQFSIVVDFPESTNSRTIIWDDQIPSTTYLNAIWQPPKRA